MAQSFPRILPIAVVVCALGGTAALAQFGNDPRAPRPPADVPGRYPQSNDPQAQFPSQQMQSGPTRITPQMQPGPSGYPPQQPVQRGQAGIQGQPLPPPPGAASAPQGPFQQGSAPVAGLPAPQRRPPPQPTDTSPQPGDEVIVAPPTQKVVNGQAVFAGLDKITGRITTFDVAIDETVQFGALQVTPRACYTRPPTEAANTDGFIEVQEITLQGEVRRIFNGWMFASSPGLHAVEHPIYDVWLTDCKNPVVAATPQQPVAEVAPQPAPAQRPRRNTTPPRPQQPAQPRQQQQVQDPGFGAPSFPRF